MADRSVNKDFVSKETTGQFYILRKIILTDVRDGAESVKWLAILVFMVQRRQKTAMSGMANHRLGKEENRLN